MSATEKPDKKQQQQKQRHHEPILAREESWPQESAGSLDESSATACRAPLTTATPQTSPPPIGKSPVVLTAQGKTAAAANQHLRVAQTVSPSHRCSKPVSQEELSDSSSASAPDKTTSTSRQCSSSGAPAPASDNPPPY
ncbi:hypothetical protein BOX15_Mlig020935g2 [Macrostomum lignano]|uniref:Uncharacterized protein n=1 Tax=Macrostomum lignano TaxID=282301 RepID=A0A267ETQ0_9PLAT|nr:hypothetical protein BOX15_Mlig020935g1 [Macrostomum lignano]PAA73752.1 hypothetical protein BOX15_Mlig020935g2 [Macrostomum lignano]